MKLILKRTDLRPDGIFGALLSEDGFRVIAMTLEHSYQEKPKIPSGTYTCRRGMHELPSKLKSFETFEVLGVPGHTGILFHSGNFNQDSSGCILLGDSVSHVFTPWMLKYSKIAFGRFMSVLEGLDTFELEVQ